MVLLHLLHQEGIEYTSLLLIPEDDLLFLGNEIGEVEVWYLPLMERRAVMRYATLDEFGDPLPIEEPVVDLASPENNQLVYAFFGNAAYCISVELLTIIEKVPISEVVLSGNIGQYTGDIGVITEVGYLSRWSAQFVERVASLDFPFQIEETHLLHDYDEERIILIFEGGKLLLSNLGEDPYTVELSYPPAEELLNNISFEKSEKYQILLTYEGTVEIHDMDSSFDLPEILMNGKINAENEIRDFIVKVGINEEDKQYITDFRLLRQSRDRYVAEVEALQKSDGKQITERVRADDGRTMMYAIKEMQTKNIDKRTTAMSVVDKLSIRHSIDPRYVYHAFRQGADASDIIDLARYYEFEAARRNKRLSKVRILGLIVGLFLLILTELISFDFSTILILGIVEFTAFMLYIYWVNINKNPKIPGVRNYRAFQSLLLISIMLSIIFELWDLFDPNLPYW